MLLPENLLSILKTAALSGGLALSAGCVMGATPTGQMTAYPDGSNVVYLPADQPGSAPVQVANQPCPYPGQATPGVVPVQNQPQPVATPDPSSPDPNSPTYHDPCPPCGMG